jgi:type II secretory pathway component PulM
MLLNSSILKLKQRLKAWNLLPEELTAKQQRLAWIGGGFLLLLLFYLAVVSPILSLEAYWGQELARKRQLLTRYQSLRESKARVAQANKAMKDALTLTEGQFLSGNNPAVASADLQEVLKNLTRDHGVNLTSTKVLQAREAGPYLEVPVQVQLSGNVAQLLTVLYHLEHHKKLLFIPELEINAPRWVAGGKEAGNLQVNLVVSGVIKKGAEPPKKGTPS